MLGRLTSQTWATECLLIGPVISFVVYVLVLCLCVIAYTLFPRWRPPGIVWQSGWRRLRWYQLGGRERVGKSSLWGRWLHPTQNHGTFIFQPFWHEPNAFLWTHRQILITCSAAVWSSMGSLIKVCIIHPCFWTANFIKSTKGWIRSQHHPYGRPLHNPHSLCEYNLMMQSYMGSKRIKVWLSSIKPLVLSTANDVYQSALACKF